MNVRALAQFARSRGLRVARWYLAPSGLLLAASLACLLLFSLSLWPRVFGPVGIALLAVFLPYRFSRQQGVAFKLDQHRGVQTSALRSSVQEAQESLVSNAQSLAEQIQVNRTELATKLTLIDGQISQAALDAARASEQAGNLQASLSDLVRHDEVNGLTQLQELRASVRELEAADIGSAGATEIDSLLEEVTILRQRIEELDLDRLTDLADSAVNRIWLASFPRSGSHWVRCLIEDITGSETGSVYPDNNPSNVPHIHTALGVMKTQRHSTSTNWWGAHSIDGGYTGGRRKPVAGGTVFVKTHYPHFSSRNDDLSTVGSILIVRDPLDAIASFQRYQRSEGTDVTDFDELLEAWINFNEYWLGRAATFIVRYETLQAEPILCLQQMFNAIGLDVDKESILQAVERYPSVNVTPSSAPVKPADYSGLGSAVAARLERIMTRIGS